MKEFIIVRSTDGLIKMSVMAKDIAEVPVLDETEYEIIEIQNTIPTPISDYKWNFTENTYELSPNKKPSEFHQWNGQTWFDPRAVTVQQQTPVTAAQARAAMYPSVEEQLDMLWHAMDDGQMAKVEPFYSSLKQVKLANPVSSEQKVWPVGKE